jgi:hypothetical protein
MPTRTRAAKESPQGKSIQNKLPECVLTRSLDNTVKNSEISGIEASTQRQKLNRRL